MNKSDLIEAVAEAADISKAAAGRAVPPAGCHHGGGGQRRARHRESGHAVRCRRREAGGHGVHRLGRQGLAHVQPDPSFRRRPRGDGRWLHERVWMSAVRDGMLLFIEDRSEQMTTSQAELQRDRLASLGFMVAGVCHEISNPLTAVQSMMQMLLGRADVSAEALPFMGWADGNLGGFPVRVFRISFSGELSYEVAAPASFGLAFWQACHDLGAEFGAMPYGTEALHVMRAEKGFIMIGDETDGTIIPQDLGLSWAISKKKADYLGKRGQERSFLASSDRPRLVGFETLDGTVIPDGAYIIAEGRNANGQRNTQGRVTSTYYSPTLKKGIAMGLIRHGPDRMGEVVEFNTVAGGTVKARIVDPVFYDKDGAKQNV